MRAALIALLLTFASQAGAECGKLCDWKWWETATTADVQAELSGGADVMARNGFGSTPLYSAAGYGTPASIQALLDAGADVMARDEDGRPKTNIRCGPRKHRGINQTSIWSSLDFACLSLSAHTASRVC
jgi:ankyrin repeat protein